MLESTKLSLTKILIVTLIYMSVPHAAEFINQFLLNETIAQTLVLSTSSIVLVLMNYDVLELHYKRLKGKSGDFIFFTCIAIIFACLVIFINENWLHSAIWSPDTETLKQYAFFNITILLAYSYGFSFTFMLAFKAITDRFKVTIGETTIILFSGLLFGLINAVSQSLGLDLTLFIPALIYHGAISMMASYSYNQTHSIFPMAIGYGTALLLTILF